MTQIICRATACLFWEQGICSAEEIEYEPDVGCLTFQDMADLELEDEDDEDLDWEEGSGGSLYLDDEDDDWEDDDEDWEDDDFDL
jgi:hypothetical protein